jgi:hypothetical protein
MLRYEQLIGTWRRFGPLGPVYEIVASSDIQSMMRIRVVESDEEIDYELSDILNDPIAS